MNPGPSTLNLSVCAQIASPGLYSSIRHSKAPNPPAAPPSVRNAPLSWCAPTALQRDENKLKGFRDGVEGGGIERERKRERETDSTKHKHRDMLGAYVIKNRG